MIKLTAVSYNNAPLSEPLSAVFGRTGGTLGRSEENAFVLPDTKHIVSRVQAEIKSDETGHAIANLSRATPMIVNGRELNYGDESPLKAGDEVQVGLYVLRAESHLTPVDAPLAEKRPGGLADTAAPITVTGSSPAASSVPQAPAMAQGAKAIAATDPSPADNHELIQAFLTGAGIEHTGVNADLTPEFMATMGKLVAAAVHGTFQLLGSRASLKREVKADVTMIVMRNNNPLKFLSDSETILVQMLRKKMPGFMGPAEAMQDAYEDLLAHQAGMVAGMHAAVGEVLKRFDPAILEKRLKDRTMLDAVMPAQRKARMWDQYTALYADIREEAQHDFDALFSQAFVAAYEKEIDRFYDEK
jgi:FHA domain-containing protein